MHPGLTLGVTSLLFGIVPLLSLSSGHPYANGTSIHIFAVIVSIQLVGFLPPFSNEMSIAFSVLTSRGFASKKPPNQDDMVPVVAVCISQFSWTGDKGWWNGTNKFATRTPESTDTTTSSQSYTDWISNLTSLSGLVSNYRLPHYQVRSTNTVILRELRQLSGNHSNMIAGDVRAKNG